jgi:hypothetical protein
MIGRFEAVFEQQQLDIHVQKERINLKNLIAAHHHEIEKEKEAHWKDTFKVKELLIETIAEQKQLEDKLKLIL